jgi:putative transposase
MAKTFTAVFTHIVFSTKGRVASLSDAMRPEVFAYLIGIARKRDVVPVRVGGWIDHVHLLLRIPPRMAISDLVRDLKCNSSAWIHR